MFVSCLVIHACLILSFNMFQLQDLSQRSAEYVRLLTFCVVTACGTCRDNGVRRYSKLRRHARQEACRSLRDWGDELRESTLRGRRRDMTTRTVDDLGTLRNFQDSRTHYDSIELYLSLNVKTIVAGIGRDRRDSMESFNLSES